MFTYLFLLSFLFIGTISATEVDSIPSNNIYLINIKKNLEKNTLQHQSFLIIRTDKISE